MNTETTTQTVEDRIAELLEAKHDQKIFVVFPAGRENDITAVGKTYEAAWKHAAELLDTNKDDLRKKGYVFDHLTVKNTQRILNGLVPEPEKVKEAPKAGFIPIGRGNLNNKHLQKIAKQARRESEDVEEEDES
jgi:hypothetical protein